MRSGIARRVLLTTVFVLVAAPALAQIVCTDTIGPGQTAVLTGNIGACTAAGNHALRVIGPATLDLAGHTVFCNTSNAPEGIVVEGKGAKILRGRVDGCIHGVLLGGEGKHKVEDLVATGNEEGYQLDSDKNTLKRVAAVDSEGEGFDIEGDGNKLEDAEAVGSGDFGFEVDGDANVFKRIVASSNAFSGVSLDGNHNKLKDCRATMNSEGGIDANGDGNKVEKCMASANGESYAGLFVEGDNNQLKKNVALGNDTGIGAGQAGSGNVIKQNVALGSAVVDLEDQSADCGSTTWQKNTFGISSADGVQNPACIQ